ncbi:hypothetical protein KSP40_PGU017657 [Platanthera guangdongensis]|uniref:Uncharacterized protein n=1 Tax=Platanthera guangdongensis TaxID=2320717 RepID=A0ABR2MAW3_9ASPA
MKACGLFFREQKKQRTCCLLLANLADLAELFIANNSVVVEKELGRTFSAPRIYRRFLSFSVPSARKKQKRKSISSPIPYLPEATSSFALPYAGA